MSTLCELVLALGFTLGSVCEDQQSEGMPLPNEDAAAWEFNAPPLPAPKSEPKPEPVRFPPVVIEKQVIVQAPAPPPPPEPKIVYVEPSKPDPVELALSRVLGNRQEGFVAIEEKAILTLPKQGVQLASLDPTNLGGISKPAAPTVRGLLDAIPSTDSYKEEKRTSSRPVDNARIITADRYITGILETGINSQLDSAEGGTAIIQTSEDVFGYHGRNILIPKGSRMICDYTSPQKQGSTRLALECRRILIGETRAEIFELQASVGNQQGHAGITGEVDNRWWEKYGSAILLSTISATVQAAASLSSNQAGSDGSVNATAAQEAAANLSERFGEISASVLERTIDLAPVIRIMQGTRVQIRPRFDWYLPEPNTVLNPQ